MAHQDSTRAVTVRSGSDLTLQGGQTDGMERYAALAEVSPHLCGSLMVAHGKTQSAVHHHGNQDTVVYCVSGSGGRIETDGGREKQELNPGDWALIPAGKEHREVNDGDTDIAWVIVRSPGGVPEVVNLTGWGGDEVKS